MIDRDMVDSFKTTINAHSKTITNLVDRVNSQQVQISELRVQISQHQKLITEIRLALKNTSGNRTTVFGDLFG